MFCHGELYELRPAPRHLTAFYLTVSAGGALGGLLVAVVAPLVFNGYYELGIGLVALALLAALRFARAQHGAARYREPRGAARRRRLRGLRRVPATRRTYASSTRNFYGVLRVKEYGTPGEDRHLRRLVHGVIMHGEQYLHDEPGAARSPPTTTRTSGVGAAIRSLREAGPAARRRDRPGDRHARGVRARGRRLPLLRHRSAR